ncbi:MAG: hypothetical protein L6R38_006043, partial [Xanthoria sp. 2 TBL-2021]
TGQLAAPEGIEYTVFPLEPQRVTSVGNFIREFAIKDTVRTITDPYRRQFNNVLYWQLRATEAAAGRLRAALESDAYLFKTTAVAEQAEIHLARNGSELDMLNVSDSGMKDGPEPKEYKAHQRSPPEDLKVVSWAPGQILANLRYYVYDTQWRAKPVIYIIDSGLDTTGPDFRLGIDKWLYSPNVKAQRKDTPTDDNPRSHGSCVLSKAIGTNSGVYKNKIRENKNSEVVVVKVDRDLPFGEILWAFSIINTDIRNSRTARPAVVAFPWTVYNTDPVPWSIIKTYFEQIFNQGGSIIVASGNNATTPGRQDVDTLPAMWESPTFPLVVVGAVNNIGTIADFSQGPTHVTVWAPGVGVQCAKRYGVKYASGTSPSTGSVAGLAAYLLALGRVRFRGNINTPTILKSRLAGTASWVRQPPNGPRVIWNMEQGY